MVAIERPKVFITGASRGIGAETAMAFGHIGWDVAIGVRDKMRKAEGVARALAEIGVEPLIIAADLGNPRDLKMAIDQVSEWAPELDGLDLNAAIGLEKGITVDDARAFNKDAQVALAKGLLPNLKAGSTVALIMSHWAQHYRDNIEMPPFEQNGKTYDVVAETKREGLEALEEEIVPVLVAKGGRFVVVTAGGVKGTPVADMGLRQHPEFGEKENKYTVTAETVGWRVMAAMTNSHHQSGHVEYLGDKSAESFLSRWQKAEA